MKLKFNRLTLTAIMLGLTLIVAAFCPIPANAVTPGLHGRYVLGGIVTKIKYENGKRLVHIVDDNGEEWVVSDYEVEFGRRVTMIMQSNGTPDDITDDIVEDVMWNCCEGN